MTMAEEPAANGPSREAWIKQALETYQRPLVSYVYKILNDLAASQDVVQDTFLKLCHQDPDKVSKRLKPWLFTVARNGALDLLRRRKRMTPLDDQWIHAMASSDRQPDEAAAVQDNLSGVERFMCRLSDNQQEVIRLKFQHDLSYQEIAETTGLKVGNVGFLLHSALKRLRELMSHHHSG